MFGLSGDGSAYAATDDKRKWDLEDATFLSDLLPGEDAGFYKAETPNPDASLFLDDQLRRAASGFGLGYSTFAGKYDKAFSLLDRSNPRIGRISNLCAANSSPISAGRSNMSQPCARRFSWVASKIPREADPDTIFTADIRGPARPTIDDLKQVQTDREMVDGKLDSRIGRIRERGRDPTRVDAEIENDPLADAVTPPGSALLPT